MAVPRIILASGSAARQNMLKNIGIPFEAIPANIEEEEFIIQMRAANRSFEDIAMGLSEQKAEKISLEYEHNTVIGSDQILVLDSELFSKAETKNDAREKLKKLRGKTHTLISAVCLARKGEIIWNAYQSAEMTMHNFSDEFLDDYLDSAGSAITDCVGAYAIESHGAWLFSEMKGDYYTILGMPLLPLIAFMYELGFRP